MSKSFLCIHDKCKIEIRTKKIKKTEVEGLCEQLRGDLNG